MAAAKPRTHRDTKAKTSSARAKTKEPAPAKETRSLRREIYGVLAAALSVMLLLALVSHNPVDADANWVGRVGNFAAEGFFFLFGLGAFFTVVLSAAVAVWLLGGRQRSLRPGGVIGGFVLMLALSALSATLFPNALAWGMPLGGWFGAAVSGAMTGVLGAVGAVLVLIASAIVGIILITRSSFVEAATRFVERGRDIHARVQPSARVRALFAGAAGIFRRRKPLEAPPLELDDAPDTPRDRPFDDRFNDDFDDAFDEAPVPVAMSTDTESPSASLRTLQEISARVDARPPAAREEAASPVMSSPSERARLYREAFDAAPAPVQAGVPDVEPLAAQAPPSASAQDGPVGVAGRAREALEKFRRGDRGATPAAPAVPVPLADPAVDTGELTAAPLPSDEPSPVVAERVRARMHNPVLNPMDSTTRQNAALRAASAPGSTPRDSSSAAALGSVVPPPPPSAAPDFGAPLGSGVLASPAPDFGTPLASPPPAPAVDEEHARFDDVRAHGTSFDNGGFDDADFDDADFDDVEFATTPQAIVWSEGTPAQERATRVVDPLDDADFDGDEDFDERDDLAEPQIIESEAQRTRMSCEDMDRALRSMAAERATSEWKLPTLDMLAYEESTTEIDKEGLRALAALLVDALNDYKIGGRVTGICPGPVVTRFEFEPDPGTKISRIAGLTEDIAMRLRAENVRIIAPIPGKGCIGVEIPNDIRETVYLKEILADRRFIESRSKLTMALGKDIEGFPVIADLAKMPHLLVAGTTGSGKSVSVNAMITSVLYNASPDEVRLILIDPKQLEFALYEDVPHLLLPVVTDSNKAATALQWAVDDMERRYRLMKELRVRNIEGYNQKIKQLQQELLAEQAGGKKASKFAVDALSEEDADGRPTHRHMPYIIVVVDEFADLMMAAGKDVEIAVARLAQKARAAGIHCILATQRPSVDVLTGTIKSNFPTRISFRLISGHDSRTVIDTVGAENLLGMGDMLYRPPGTSDLVRVHGAFVDEDEIERVVDFLKSQREVEYDETILSAQISESDEDMELDAKFEEAVDLVISEGVASISLIQRRLRVGYNRAANIVEDMERRGIIGPSMGGASQREVLISR